MLCFQAFLLSYVILFQAYLHGLKAFPFRYLYSKHCEDFICGICLNVLKDPSQCQNGHMFCFSCINQAMKTRQLCPCCNIPLYFQSLSYCLTVRNLIDKLTVKCTNQNCDWTGHLNQRKHHMTVCSMRLVVCPLRVTGLCSDPKCNSLMSVNELNGHVASVSCAVAIQQRNLATQCHIWKERCATLASENSTLSDLLAEQMKTLRKLAKRKFHSSGGGSTRRPSSSTIKCRSFKNQQCTLLLWTLWISIDNKLLPEVHREISLQMAARISSACTIVL